MRNLSILAILTLALFSAPHQSAMGAFCTGAMHAQTVAAQQGPPSMPPPGNPKHDKPHPKAYCDRSANQPAHSCKCHKRCAVNDKGEVQYDKDGNVKVVEADNCRAWCFKDHCHCSVICP